MIIQKLCSMLGTLRVSIWGSSLHILDKNRVLFGVECVIKILRYDIILNWGLYIVRKKICKIVKSILNLMDSSPHSGVVLDGKNIHQMKPVVGRKVVDTLSVTQDKRSISKILFMDLIYLVLWNLCSWLCRPIYSTNMYVDFAWLQVVAAEAASQLKKCAGITLKRWCRVN